MAKSNSVKTDIFYPYPNTMIVLRKYEYIKGYDAHREQAKKQSFRGWTYLGSSKLGSEYYGLAKEVEIWTVMEIYIKKGTEYNMP